MRTARISSRLRGGCLPQCMLGYIPGVGLETPPGQTPQLHPGCGPGQTPQLPPWVWAWRPQARPLNFPLGVGLGPVRHAGIPPQPPPHEQNS